MKKFKFISVAVLTILLLTFTKSKSSEIVYDDSNEGSYPGSISVAVVGDNDAYGYGEFDPYILGGLNVSYNLNGTGGSISMDDDQGTYHDAFGTTLYGSQTSVNDTYWEIAFFAYINQTVTANVTWSM